MRRFAEIAQRIACVLLFVSLLFLLTSPADAQSEPITPGVPVSLSQLFAPIMANYPSAVYWYLAVSPPEPPITLSGGTFIGEYYTFEDGGRNFPAISSG